MAAIAFLLALVASLTGGPVYEDDPIVGAMGNIAVLVMHEHGCDADRWDFNVDDSGGVRILAISEACEQAAEFYRAPDGIRWTFAIEGS
jgi:hypothetical protein